MRLWRKLREPPGEPGTAESSQGQFVRQSCHRGERDKERHRTGKRQGERHEERETRRVT